MVLTVLLPAGILLAYIAAAFLLVLFPANSGPSPAAGIEAYVVTNGVHTDLVFPVKNKMMDWERYFPKTQFAAVPADAGYIAIGWGDRDFYLNTPEWKDLSIAAAAGALTGRHATLLHVTYASKADLGHAYKLTLTEQAYRALAEYVLASAKTQDQHFIQVPYSGYSRQDSFYEATGSYSMFNTCNTWVGKGLLRAGVKVGRWTPFDALVVWHLPRG